MCLYYGNKPGLHYTSGDHIFPAAIGGIKKLPKGMVSDEFNTAISAIELHFIRNSPISIPRTFEGPGRRGRLGDTHAVPSNICVITNEKENVYALGYHRKHKPYEIPYISWNTTTKNTSISLNNDPGIDFKSSIAWFYEKSKTIDAEKIINLDGKALPKDLILFGISEDKKGDTRYFLAKNPNNNSELTVPSIQKISKDYHEQEHDVNVKSYKGKLHMQVDFKDEYFRIYAKTAINFLGSVNDVEFLKRNEFKPIIDWVANGGENIYAWIDPPRNIIDATGFDFPDSSHFVAITKNDINDLIAYVSLYKGLNAYVTLAKDFKENYNLDGLVCDWKNKKEYRLMEYFEQLVEDFNK